jgi:hypothetical protein
VQLPPPSAAWNVERAPWGQILPPPQAVQGTCGTQGTVRVLWGLCVPSSVALWSEFPARSLTVLRQSHWKLNQVSSVKPTN